MSTLSSLKHFQTGRALIKLKTKDFVTAASSDKVTTQDVLCNVMSQNDTERLELFLTHSVSLPCVCATGRGRRSN